MRQDCYSRIINIILKSVLCENLGLFFAIRLLQEYVNHAVGMTLNYILIEKRKIPNIFFL